MTRNDRCQSDRPDRGVWELRRRRLLGALGSAGLGLTAGCEGGPADGSTPTGGSTPAGSATTDSTATTTGDGGEDASEFAPADHDHSGEFGASSRLGEASPVDRIDVGTLVNSGSPLVDVRAYGAVGDGETDDAAALQRAADAATPHGVLYVPADMVLALGSPVDVDLGLDSEETMRELDLRQNRFAFVCHGALRPGERLGNAVHIHHGSNPYLSVRLDGGGRSVVQDTALRVTDMNGGYVEGFANRYDGTVLRVDPGETKVSAFSVGTLVANQCGQALRMSGVGGQGEIGNVWDLNPVRCPEFRGSNDISINQYENLAARTERGLVFDSCNSVWIDKLALGGGADYDAHVTFNACSGVNVNKIFAFKARSAGVRIQSTEYVVLHRVRAQRSALGLEVSEPYGPPTRMVRATLDTQDCSKPFVVADDITNGDDIRITGGMHGYDEPPEINATAPDDVRVTDAYLDSGSADVPDLSLAEGTSVRIEASHVPDVDGEPRLRNGVGRAARDADTPDAANWEPGSVVEFTDTGDGSGDGVYLLLPSETWHPL